jgi:hypothetical protein
VLANPGAAQYDSVIGKAGTACPIAQPFIDKHDGTNGRNSAVLTGAYFVIPGPSYV